MPETRDTIRLRYASSCHTCGSALHAGERARWDKAAKAATCLSCLAIQEPAGEDVLIGESEASLDLEAALERHVVVEPVGAPEDGDGVGVGLEQEAPIERGVPGRSAAREWNRRHEKRVTAIRSRHKHLGGMILALTKDPSSTTAWETGARGERLTGEKLDRLRSDEIAVLHDRLIPRSRRNIDHVIISRAGVFVVDTKRYKGRVVKRNVGGLFRSDHRLYVGGRDKTALLDGMPPQVAAVRAALDSIGIAAGVPVVPVILFMLADNWTVLGPPLRFGTVHVVWRKRLVRMIRADGPVAVTDVSRIERAIAAALPRA
ncbi:MAG TPA: nuclease-related domain-containing protein [Gaiellaceae bacterium]